MIYSKWIPDKGGYAYYETPQRLGLGDDLPTPWLRQTSDIGVASTDIGRALPLGAKIVGYGPLAKGSVTALDRSGLSGIAAQPPERLALWLGVAAVSVFAGIKITRSLRR